MTSRENFKVIVKDALDARAEDLFELVWGEPQRRGGHEWRPRGSTSRAMEMRGPKRGLWHDHAASTGGDLLDLIAVEFCGLEKAAQDFPRVMNEAANWCGISQDKEIDLEPLKQRQQERKRTAEAETKAERETKMQLVKDLTAWAQPIEGTPAAAYLASRGITDLPVNGLAYLGPVAGRGGVLHPNFAACVVWGMDDQGNVAGGQRIVLREDGTRPTLEAGKPSFAYPNGHPARFAARVSDGPLCIAEGPESALSVWMATGYETWAVFGVSGWQAAPIPAGRKVILCPDQDAPEGMHPAGSEGAKRKEKAARGFNKAIAHHAARGCDLWIAQAPEPVGSKRDLNDTHQRAGLQAVRDAIAGASRGPQTPAPQCDAPDQSQRVTLPRRADLPDGRKETLLLQMQEATTTTALPVAVAVAHQMQLTAPLIYTPKSIAETIAGNMGDRLSEREVSAIKARVEWLQERRREAVLNRTAITPRAAQHHDTMTVKDLGEVSTADLSGVMLIKAPMAAGKTQLIGRPFVLDAKAKGGGVMAIAHRVTLISELSNRLWLPNYQSVSEGDIEAAGGVAVCLPSTARADIIAALPCPKYLFIDEIAQVLQFLAEKMCAAGIADNRAVYQRLEQLVRDAHAVVVADADLDLRTLRFLEKCRPNERFKIIEMKPKPTDRRAVVYPEGGEVIRAISVELEAGGKVWLSCEGAVKAAAIAKMYQKRGYRALCITADTKLNRQEQAFLEDADEQSRAYDLVISSPAISSGLSIEHRKGQHFTLGAYIGTGTATRPEDAKQQLGRVRYLSRYVIGIERSNLTGGQSIGAYRKGAEDAAAIEGVSAEWTDFDSYVAGVKTDAANAKADFAAGLWFGLEAAGWKLEHPIDTDTPDARRQMKEATAQHKAERALAVITAEKMDSHQAGLTESMARNSEQETRRLAHRLRLALGKLDLTEADVEFWDEGRGREKIARFEDLIGAEIDLPEESGVLLTQRRFRMARRRLYAIIFDGVDIGEPITPDLADTILDRVMTRPEACAGVGIVGDKYRAKFAGKGGIISEVKRPKQAGREVAEILKRCGLKVSSKKARNVPKRILLVNKRDGFGTERGLGWVQRVAPDSFAFMADILGRKGTFDIDTALARADKTYAEPAPASVCPWPRRLVIDTGPAALHEGMFRIATYAEGDPLDVRLAVVGASP